MDYSNVFEGVSSENILTFCGYNWFKNGGDEKKSLNSTFHTYSGYLSNNEIGAFFITANAFRLLNEKEEMYYKTVSLVYELCTYGKMYSIGEDENDLLKGPTNDDNYISCTIDTLLKYFPTDFMQIQHRSLLSLYRKYPNYGQFIRNVEEYEFFAKSNQELGFILDSLICKNYLEGDVLWNGDGSCRFKAPYKITMDGWVEIEKSICKNNSNHVFIAMSFNENLKSIRNSIKKAIVDAGFLPVVIDEIEHINYIPLEIQNKIKGCGFMVADFTTQNHGAYFEAGYAMGQNIPVIWCCRDDDKQNLHFDIRQYNNILWDNEDDLYNRLLKRLKALKG